MPASDFDIDALPLGEYAYPGPVRDRLVAAILSGAKRSTSSLAEEWIEDGFGLPGVGDLEAVINSDGVRVCITRNVAVEVRRLADVADSHAVKEGEGFRDAAQWRVAHERFWSQHSSVRLTDDTQIVCVEFEVIHRVG